MVSDLFYMPTSTYIIKIFLSNMNFHFFNKKPNGKKNILYIKSGSEIKPMLSIFNINPEIYEPYLQ